MCSVLSKQCYRMLIYLPDNTVTFIPGAIVSGGGSYDDVFLFAGESGLLVVGCLAP